MIQSFWDTITKPFVTIAPMADVTDVAFRELLFECGPPAFYWTEFVSCDGLLSKGKEKLLIDLAFTENQRPIIAQLFSGKPDSFYKCAKLVKELSFDGIDINMGCPDRSIEKQGAGANLIQDPKRAQEIIYATKEGAGGLPVSVKTRIGYAHDEIDTWIPALLECDPAALTIHARTRKEMSKVPAQWDTIKRAVGVRDAMGSTTLIIGNGDVVDVHDAHKKIEETGADGVALGRALFGNPWILNESIKKEDLPREKIMSTMIKHTKLFEKYLGAHKNFAIMRKHFGSYVLGFPGAKDLKGKLMCAESAQDVEEIVREYIDNGGLT